MYMQGTVSRMNVHVRRTAYASSGGHQETAAQTFTSFIQRQGPQHRPFPLQVRCLSLPQRLWARRWACMPCLVIPRPTEPKSLRGYLEPLATSFERLQCGVPMLMHVNEAMLHCLPPSDTRQAQPHPRVPGMWQVPIVHHGYLYDLVGDTPARVKMMNWGWFTAKHGACGWCAVVGNVMAGSTVRFMGYVKKLRLVMPWRGIDASASIILGMTVCS